MTVQQQCAYYTREAFGCYFVGLLNWLKCLIHSCNRGGRSVLISTPELLEFTAYCSNVNRSCLHSFNGLWYNVTRFMQTVLQLVCCISRSVLLQIFNFLFNICNQSIIPLKTSFVFGKEMAKIFTDTSPVSKGVT